MTTTLQGVAPARMAGGPMAGQTGEVTTPPPEWLYFGREGGFCYRLDSRATPRKVGGRPVALYRFDRRATREKLLLLGLPMETVDLAVRDDREALLQASYAEGMRERESGGTEIDVRIELHDDEWRVYAAGELVHTVGRAEIDPDDLDAIRDLAQTVGSAVIRDKAGNIIEGELA